jgi:hypothetical protein
MLSMLTEKHWWERVREIEEKRQKLDLDQLVVEAMIPPHLQSDYRRIIERYYAEHFHGNNAVDQQKRENTMKTITPEQVAKICHETNRAYCSALGDNSQLPWEESPEWQRTSAINGVIFHRNNPSAKPSASHESWLEEKRVNGWSYGPTKDPEKKQHPCFIPFDGLPLEQQAKDYLFKAVVDSVRFLIEPPAPIVPPLPA